ncbi:cryptochrome/photolyase family protein [Qingshengfaniella alkalisoli]|uniref:Deoxyribodipyrimidine photo-lyase n=1 Tax=Qingshengfaniella alkalisoli TaxID=2599296 RepID=A0A5B8ISH9_9RHOB|nr:deoxyribodipyrimidine photo-lyase [Qingshengfaniella alkalisoli]QDY69172.1 deoxyribodipyrimidine photo-lyase [Qingshengfaniella alkalisoli]
MTSAPVIWWIRRDLRLDDNAALNAAIASRRAIIPLFIRDALVDNIGAAAKIRLEEGLKALSRSLRARGSKLILRHGDAESVLLDLAKKSGAGMVVWSRLYLPDTIERDRGVKAAVQAAGLTARSYAGHVLFEPWTVQTGQGDHYKVYTPFWKAVRSRDVVLPDSAPDRLPAPEHWPDSDTLSQWNLAAAMNRGAGVVQKHIAAGEAAAYERLATFLDDRLNEYGIHRDRLDRDATSGMSDYLSLGEISPARLWHAARRHVEEGCKGAETYLKELVWRDFAYHLAYHTPRLLTDNWREEWSDFAWQEDQRLQAVKAWKQGRTGVDVVDAAMRELYVTGRMHNRARMIVASFLTKNLGFHWKIGMDWFGDCLIDWDPASNALGWQWVAGSGPDAAPYFRIFNPQTQAEKFDPDGKYRARWLAKNHSDPSDDALAFYDAIPRSWNLSVDDDPPDPLVDLKKSRTDALDRYERFRNG